MLEHRARERASLSKAFPSTQRAAKQVAGRGTTPESPILFEESLDYDLEGPGGHSRRQ